MSSDTAQFGFTTRQLHAGQQPDPTTGSRAVPIYQTTSYVFKDTEHAARLFALQESGNIYTRIMNPTSDVFEQRMADLEGGVGALAASFGPCRPDAWPSSPCAAPATTSSRPPPCTAAPTTSSPTPSRAWASRSPWSTRSDPENFRRAIRPNTKILYGETLGNPRINVFPFEEVAAIAQAARHPADDRQHLCHALPVPPVRVGRQHRRPLDHQVHRRARHLHRRRHRGRRQLRLGRQRRASPTSTSPTPAITAWSTPALGAPAFILKARVQILRDIGACQSPFNSWLFLQGLETLSLRMERHVAECPGGGRVPGGAPEGRAG